MRYSPINGFEPIIQHVNEYTFHYIAHDGLCPDSDLVLMYCPIRDKFIFGTYITVDGILHWELYTKTTLSQARAYAHGTCGSPEININYVWE